MRRRALHGGHGLTGLLLTAGAVLLAGCGGASGPPASEGSGQPEVRELVILVPPAPRAQTQGFSAPQASITDALRRLDAVRRDEDAKGLLLRVGPLGGAWGRVAELRAGVAAVRQAGKPVHCHFEVVDNLAYALLASSCDRISMTPAGDLNLVGVAAHLFYARAMLERIGLRADFMQVGRYKGAADTFTRDDMPEEVRENLGALLDDLQGWIASAVVEGRGLSAEEIQALIDGGPYDAARARSAGLVDDIGFVDEARQHLRTEANTDVVRRVRLKPKSTPGGLLELLEALTGNTAQGTPEGARIALVYLDGGIVDEDRSGPSGARSGPFVRAMRSFADDEDIKAMVLRIDSPGGSALASDRMWHAVRRVAAKKPVIVSVGDMAASGGYYVASAATRIFANATSIVGSIGVVGGKITIAELAENIGVRVEVLERGQHSAWTSPTRPFTAEEREILERMMNGTYDRFLRRIIAGREMERAQVEAVAEGRIFSGSRAIELGLVDREGGIWEALANARSEAGLDPYSPIERWPRDQSLLEAIAEGMGEGEPADRGRVFIEGLMATAGPLGEAAMLAPMLFGHERVAVALPYVLRIE